MANVLTANPIKLDTTGATSAIANRLKIKAIVWDSGDSGAAGDNCVIHDANGGDVVWQATVGTAKETISSYLGGVWVEGLYLTTLNNGVVLVYLE